MSTKDKEIDMWKATGRYHYGPLGPNWEKVNLIKDFDYPYIFEKTDNRVQEAINDLRYQIESEGYTFDIRKVQMKYSAKDVVKLYYHVEGYSNE